MVRMWARIVVGCFLAVSLGGCGGKGDGLYPVKGKITYQGKALAGATVVFAPSGQGQPAQGVTDDSGQYTLNTSGKPGALIGKYKVTVTKVEKPAGAADLTPENVKPQDMMKMAKASLAAKALIPSKYASGATSGLDADVTTDSSRKSFDYALTD